MQTAQCNKMKYLRGGRVSVWKYCSPSAHLIEFPMFLPRCNCVAPNMALQEMSSRNNLLCLDEWFWVCWTGSARHQLTWNQEGIFHLFPPDNNMTEFLKFSRAGNIKPSFLSRCVATFNGSVLVASSGAPSRFVGTYLCLGVTGCAPLHAAVI